MLRYRVLDPACGSGNFLYVAYRELKRLELELLEKIHDNFGGRTRELAGGTSLVSAGSSSASTSSHSPSSWPRSR